MIGCGRQRRREPVVGQPDGLDLNELTAAADRDPFAGCAHHKTVACRVSPAPV